MNNLPADMVIAMNEVKHAVTVLDGIENRLREAMKLTRNHWMCTDEDKRFRAAIGGVMLSYGIDSPEFKRLEKEFSSLHRLNIAINAAIQGIPVDFGEMVDDMKDVKQVGIMKLWKELGRQ